MNESVLVDGADGEQSYVPHCRHAMHWIDLR